MSEKLVRIKRRITKDMPVFLKHEQLNKDYSFYGTTGRRPRRQSSKQLIDSEHCAISHKAKSTNLLSGDIGKWGKTSLVEEREKNKAKKRIELSEQVK